MTSDGPTESARKRRGKTKQREVLPEVLRDLKFRVMTVGMKVYGRQLTTNDGRDSLQDLYEELLDAAVYIKKAIMERDRCAGS